MGKVNKNQCKSNKVTPYPSPSCCKKLMRKFGSEKKHGKASSQKDYDGATCPVCLESPHNAVLLLCSSYHKGCRPYMCATNSRFSNCLDQYKKAYTEKTERPELLCPLCRGQVKGWAVVEDARKHLNSKKRACMHGNCSFSGNFQKLRKHVKENHPHARPCTVDPALKEKWKKLERERDRRDVISTIMSSTPGAVVLGDYVIEPYNNNGIHVDDSDSDDSIGGDFLELDPRHGQGSRIRFFDLENDDFTSSRPSTAVIGHALRRLLFGRSGLFRRINEGR